MSELSHLMHFAEKLHHAVDHEMKGRLGHEIADIIKQHATIAATASLVPVPLIDSAIVFANTWAMYGRINQQIDIPFGDNVVKSIAMGIVTNILTIVPGLLLAKLGGALLKAIPGLGTVGGIAVDAATNYALVTVMGIVYLKALTLLISSKKPLTEENIKAASAEVAKDKSFIKETIQKAKSEYKPDTKPETA